METLILTANHAVSYGAWSSRVKFVAAYPITPQTTIVEMLSEFISSKKMDAEFMTVESEHSALAAVTGAESTGVRSFTATSSHGLLYMSEMVHWVARARLPIVMPVVNRALAPPWSIWVDHTDTMSHRDTGWIQIYVSNNQEAYDMVLQGYRLGEDRKVSMPVMICMDAFLLSHTFAPVKILTPEETDSFLPPYKPLWKLDPENPFSVGGITTAEHYYEFSEMMDQAHRNAGEIFDEISREYEKVSGLLQTGKIEKYRVEDAESVILALGTMAEETRVAVDRLRAEGEKVGLVKVKMFRPFPNKEIREALENKSLVVVMDRSVSYGHEGPLSIEVKSTLYPSENRPPVLNFIVGLGGRDVTFKDIVSFHKIAKKKVTEGKKVTEPIFVQLKV